MWKSTLPPDQNPYHLPWWSVSLYFFLALERPGSHDRRRNILCSYFVWLMCTRTFKLLPHLWNRPQDIIHVPAFILFGYYFAIMKLYALFTLHEVRELIALSFVCRR